MLQIVNMCCQRHYLWFKLSSKRYVGGLLLWWQQYQSIWPPDVYWFWFRPLNGRDDSIYWSKLLAPCWLAFSRTQQGSAFWLLRISTRIDAIAGHGGFASHGRHPQSCLSSFYIRSENETTMSQIIWQRLKKILKIAMITMIAMATYSNPSYDHNHQKVNKMFRKKAILKFHIGSHSNKSSLIFYYRSLSGIS